MHTLALRSARWPLALATLALFACVDQPDATGPDTRDVVAHTTAGDVIMVTNASGGSLVGGLPWAISQLTGGETIRFDPSLAGITITPNWTLETFVPVTIEGPAEGGITIAGRDMIRVFRFHSAATLRNLSVTRGLADRGSAIQATGPLLLEHVTVFDNFGSRGAIHGDDITLINSTVAGNHIWEGASGIAYTAGGRLTLINSTVARNHGSPAIARQGPQDALPIVTLQNSIIADNQPQNCGNTDGFHYEGMNIATDPSCGFVPGIVVADPWLDMLADHGGPNPTFNMDRRSPAINALESCSVAVDQRYVPRDTYCDIGAVEFTDFTIVTITLDSNGSVSRADGSAVLRGTVTCSRTETERVGLQIELTQAGKGSQPPVQAIGHAATDCTTTAQPWSATLTPSSGTFTNGNAAATVRTSDTPTWFKPASFSGNAKLAWRK